LVDGGSFAKLEERASVVPFDISGEQFNRLFTLADGIYPQYSQFVKGIKVPITASKKLFTEWQEAARKDIERAFGVLQSRFQIVAHPFHAHSLIKISNTVTACLIMHNMCVSDGMMDGNMYAIYDPAHNVNEQATLELDMIAVAESNRNFAHGESVQEHEASAIGLGNAGNIFVVQPMLVQQDNWKERNDRYKRARLHAALKQIKVGQNE
jgi:hypothetical protein